MFAYIFLRFKIPKVDSLCRRTDKYIFEMMNWFSVYKVISTQVEDEPSCDLSPTEQVEGISRKAHGFSIQYIQSFIV